MPAAEDSTTLRTDPTLQQVYPPATLVTVGADLGASEELELGHRVRVGVLCPDIERS